MPFAGSRKIECIASLSLYAEGFGIAKGDPLPQRINATDDAKNMISSAAFPRNLYVMSSRESCLLVIFNSERSESWKEPRRPNEEELNDTHTALCTRACISENINEEYLHALKN